MAVADDTYVFDSSLGEVTVQWAWNKWVAVSARHERTIQGQVGDRRALVNLLVEIGLPRDEADSAGRDAWRKRPPRSLRLGEPDAWESPWRGNSFAALMAVLVGLLAMLLYFFWLKLDWVAL